MAKKITLVRKDELKSAYNFPDTRFSPGIFIQLFDEIEKLSLRVTELEKVKE